MEQDIIGRLQRLGIPGYESRAYLALLGGGTPMNGYEVAKRSGVPRGTVYQTLQKLVDRGLAFEVEDGRTSAYLPLPPDAFLARLRHDFEESSSFLQDALRAATEPPDTTLMHHIRGKDAMLARAGDVIRSAREELWVSMWPEEIKPLRPDIGQAERRGVEVVLLSFGSAEGASHAYEHRFADPSTVLNRVGCRLLVVVADRRMAIIGGGVGDDLWGTYSEDPAVVLVCVEFVLHDVTTQLLCERIGAEEAERVYRQDPMMVRILDRQTGTPGLRDIAAGTGAPAAAPSRTL